MRKELPNDAVVPFEVPPVTKEVLVPCTCAVAFSVFTRDIHLWWPTANHSLGGADTTGVTIEPRVGGRIFEQHANGSEHDWGVVTVWEAPTSLAFTWQVAGSPEQAQRIDVTFVPADAGTRVRLVHSGWQASQIDALRRDEYNNGWELVFVLSYARHAGRATTTALGQK